MIHYAGVPLKCPDPDTVERATRLLDPAEVWPWQIRHAPPRRLAHLGWRAPRAMLFRLESLVWPSGASRWAYGHYLVTATRMEQILDAVARSGLSGGGECDLVLDDGRRSLTIPMYALPPRPLFAVPGAGQLHLLTLVDDRWRWWWVASSITLTAGTTSWATLYASIGTALGVTITADDVAAAYLEPPVELVSRYEALPVLLDAVAYSVGQRVVRDADGTVRALSASSSRTRETTNLALTPRKMGGALYSSPG